MAAIAMTDNQFFRKTVSWLKCDISSDFPTLHIVWKLLNMSHLNFWILVFSTNICPIKTDQSGNTVWPQASGFQKLAKMDHLWHFWWSFVHSKCKRSSLRSQSWMKLFLWFSNTVPSHLRKYANKLWWCHWEKYFKNSLIFFLSSFSQKFRQLFALTNGKPKVFKTLVIYELLPRKLTLFENHRKSLIQHCEQSELRLHFEWTKVH